MLWKELQIPVEVPTSPAFHFWSFWSNFRPSPRHPASPTRLLDPILARTDWRQKSEENGIVNCLFYGAKFCFVLLSTP